MNVQRYRFRLSGLREEPGRIEAASLHRVLDALVKTAERAIRLLATGEGDGRGKRPGWLDAVVNFTITGMDPGSTTFAIEAPRLRAVVPEGFAQHALWCEQPSPDDTALDLIASALDEIGAGNPSGDRFDTAVLQALLLFRSAAGRGVRYEMIPEGSARRGFLLDDSAWERVRTQLKRVPEPRAFIVSGRTEEIWPGNGRFLLVTSNGSCLHGRLDPGLLDMERLRPLWGNQATIEGVVHFKINGQPRFIQARRIRGLRDGDEVFDEIPSVESWDTHGQVPFHPEQTASLDPMELVGLWPGDEPLEELLAQLD